MMVSRYDESRFLLALQIDHSRVAGFLAAHWGNAEFAEPRPYASVVLAAQEHDSGWWEWEVKPSTLNDRGYPLDYVNDGSLKYLGKFRLDFYKNGIGRVAQRDPYAGLLTLMHGVGLCNQGYGLLPRMVDHSANPLVQDYIRDLEPLRLKLLDDVRRSAEFQEVSTDEHIWVNYRLMEVFDQLGQFICNRYPLNSKERRNGPTNVVSNVPVGAGREDVTVAVEVLDEKRAVVRPYPFDEDPLETSFAARLVPIKQYQSPDDFLRDFYKAERLTVSYSLQAG